MNTPNPLLAPCKQGTQLLGLGLPTNNHRADADRQHPDRSELLTSELERLFTVADSIQDVQALLGQPGSQGDRLLESRAILSS